MSKIKYFLITLLTATCCFSAVYAQKTVKPKVSKTPEKKSFNEKDLSNLQKNAEKQLEGIPYRLTTITEEFADGKTIPTKYEKHISEELPPDRSRFITEKKTAKGIEREEFIKIGRERFIRENNSEWKIFQPTGRGMGSGSGSGDGSKVDYTEESYMLAGEMLNGQKTDRYETIIRYTFTYSDRVEKRTITEAHWFNQKGLLVKKLDEINDEAKKTISRTTEHYEYDVKLKIEKPIVK